MSSVLCQDIALMRENLFKITSFPLRGRANGSKGVSSQVARIRVTTGLNKVVRAHNTKTAAYSLENPSWRQEDYSQSPRQQRLHTSTLPGGLSSGHQAIAGASFYPLRYICYELGVHYAE